MNTHFQPILSNHSSALQTRWAAPLAISGRRGQLTVLSGQVWLTRRGDPDDHVLHAGQCMWLTPADDAVVEQWQRDQPASLHWQPEPTRRWRAVADAAISVFARVLHNARVATHRTADAA